MAEYDYFLLNAYGSDVYISDNVVIKRPRLISVGSHIAIDSYFYITTAAELGDYIHIGPMVVCIGGATVKLKMGNFTTIATGCRLICGSDKHLGAGLVSPVIPAPYRDDVILGNVTLENFASLGSNVVVMPSVTLGEGAIVGANSFVNKDVPAWEVWIGSPAKFVKSRPSNKMKEYAHALGYDL